MGKFHGVKGMRTGGDVEVKRTISYTMAQGKSISLWKYKNQSCEKSFISHK